MSVFLQSVAYATSCTYRDRSIGAQESFPGRCHAANPELLIITVAEPTENLALLTFILCVCPSRSSQLTSLFRAIWWSSNIIRYKKM